MKKIFINLPIFFLFFLLVFCFLGFTKLKNAIAAEKGTCECFTAGEDIGMVPNCDSACEEHCLELTTFPEGHAMPVKSCTDTTDPLFSGMKECVCGFTVPNVTVDQCSDGCNPFSHSWSALTVEINTPCSSQEDCNGTAGYCVHSRCYCNEAAGECRSKIEKGDPCEQNIQCISEYCYFQGDDRTQKICLDASLQPPETDTDTTPESEVFPTYNIKSPIGEVTGPQLIGRIIKTVLTLVGALALLMFVYGGFTWLTSGGSADKIKKGKDILMWATIGLIVIFSSYTLVDFLLKSFGL